MSSEGGYLYVHGGPYEAGEELINRFGHVCSDEEIQSVIEDVEADGNFEWAPVHPNYDAQFAYEANIRGAAHQSFF